MAWLKCDQCDGDKYTDDNPFVEFRQQRPSDHAEMTCVLAGHARCYRIEVASLPQISDTGGQATPAQWEAWIESTEARAAGYLWLT
jgi:hypothetical protein